MPETAAAAHPPTTAGVSNAFTAGLTPAVFDREAGHRTLDVLQGEAAQGALFPWLEGLAPGFADWVVTALFGGTYQRPGLTLTERQLVNLAALAALGGVEPQLTGHVATSLRVGLSREQVVEVFVHLAPYIGVPKALAGLRAAAAAFAAEPANGTGAGARAGTGTKAENGHSAGAEAGNRHSAETRANTEAATDAKDQAGNGNSAGAEAGSGTGAEAGTNAAAGEGTYPGTGTVRGTR